MPKLYYLNALLFAILQMEKVEEDLARSKNLREKQAKEFSRQLDDLKIKHEKEVTWSVRSLEEWWIWWHLKKV